MEELNFNMSWENSFNHSNMNMNFSSSHYNQTDFRDMVAHIIMWVNWITLGIGLPLVLIVMIAVFFQVKKDQGAPVYVINLLISDFIQLCSRSLINIHPSEFVALFITYYGLFVSVGFMMCVSFERYLVVAKPLWYRFRRNIKIYVVVCIVVWILPLLFQLFAFLTLADEMAIIFIVVLLLPFPLFIFFLVGTIKALSGALSVPADEKRRIAAIQVVVLINYTLLYLPFIILLLSLFHVIDDQFRFNVSAVSVVCMCLSPLADTTLYLFIRKSIMDKFLASLCSCKISNNQEMSSTDYESRTATATETV
ncbi:G-protein coupled receptor 4-like [Poecilia reticulata]|uniref:G-protein coupled receptor 4-like n=1 Tax=Poecilia reticulata TaxID=8081 RepID=UPI0007EA6A66|nr:PREDICTED: G-protein coupled receptor 4-like [Poecilia reticulata]